MVSSLHITFSHCSERGAFLCSTLGSFPRQTVLHELVQHKSIPQATVLCKLLQHESIPWARVLPKLLPCESLFHGCSSSRTSWSTVGTSLHRPPMGSQSPPRHPPPLAQAPTWAAGGFLHSHFCALQGHSSFTMASPRAVEKSQLWCLEHLLHH